MIWRQKGVYQATSRFSSVLQIKSKYRLCILRYRYKEIMYQFSMFKDKVGGDSLSKKQIKGYDPERF